MSKGLRMILWVLCVVMILSAPFLISSPAMLSEVKRDMMEQMDEEEGEELDFSRILFGSARAEDPDAVEEEIVEDDPEAFGEAVYTLPTDFTVPPAPKAENYTEDGYADETIRVTVEEREADGVIWHLAFVKIASATQFRTATAGKLTSNKTAHVSAMARNNHAVVAINGDNFVDKPDSTLFEYRMGQKIRSKTNRLRDILIIDENGDFHFAKARPTLSKDQAKKEQAAELEKIAEEHTIVNAYCFGPALVIDGTAQEIDPDYKYNPKGKEPRAAIGQTGRLSYVLVIAEGRGESAGCTQQTLADYMAEIGCRQAYNLDGGNSAEMVFGDRIYKGMPGGDERSLSDIIYFATAVPEE